MKVKDTRTGAVIITPEQGIINHTTNYGDYIALWLQGAFEVDIEEEELRGLLSEYYHLELNKS